MQESRKDLTVQEESTIKGSKEPQKGEMPGHLVKNKLQNPPFFSNFFPNNKENSMFFSNFFSVSPGEQSLQDHCFNYKALKNNNNTPRIRDSTPKDKPMTLMLWNLRALSYLKTTFLKSRREDIIILNETWLQDGKTLEIKGYNTIAKNRTNQIGGGVAILLNHDIKFKVIDTKIKETLIIKINFERNKSLYIITSYFPQLKFKKKWERRWKMILDEIIDKCSENSLENVIIAGDFNRDLVIDNEILEEMNRFNLKLISLDTDVTHTSTTSSSRIDFFMTSNELHKYCTIKTEKGLGSDHKVVQMAIKECFEYKKNRIKIPNRKLAAEATFTALLESGFMLDKFLSSHTSFLKNSRAMKWNTIKQNLDYKDKIKKTVEENEFDTKLIEEALNTDWNNLWKEIQEDRFSKRQKRAFNTIKTVLKYHTFEKRDGSVMNKVLVNDQIITDSVKVNHHIKNALEILTGKDNEPTYQKSKDFPNLPPLTIPQIQELVNILKQNKAIANDFMEDSTLFSNVQSYAICANMFCELWTQKSMDNKEMIKHLTGRLIPLNKVHPKIPEPTQMRPIIALSPILKLLEIRFKPKLDKYLNERMTKAQTGFVQHCGTHINIMRILHRCLYFKDQSRRACVLFIDFKSAYNNVNLECLFQKLRVKNILDPLEIDFLRALYSNTTVTIGETERLQINKGVMQGSIISPALFDIFVEDLVEEMVKINQEINVFAYADDLADVIDSFYRLNLTIDVIEKWSKEWKTPLNYDKSGILNIKNRSNSQRMVTGKTFRNFPVVTEYKYLGIWLGETLHPKYHFTNVKVSSKIAFIEAKLRTIARETTTPYFVINLWTLFIRPLFDYAIIHALIYDTGYIETVLKKQRKSFKEVLKLKKSTNNSIVEGMMGYHPLELAKQFLEQAGDKWSARLHNLEFPLKNKSYKIDSDTILMNWDTIKCNNLMNSGCATHSGGILTPHHLRTMHNYDPEIDIPDLLQKGRDLHLILKCSTTPKRKKQRIYAKIIELKKKHQEVVKILTSFKKIND